MVFPTPLIATRKMKKKSKIKVVLTSVNGFAFRRKILYICTTKVEIPHKHRDISTFFIHKVTYFCPKNKYYRFYKVTFRRYKVTYRFDKIRYYHDFERQGR